MSRIDFYSIVTDAWRAYDDSRKIERVEDISARVSTNHVYRIRLTDDTLIIAKLSYFGTYDHFLEDHAIINSLSNNLPRPFENILARSLMKGNELYVYRHQQELVDVWVVFYRPIDIGDRLPRRQTMDGIASLGEQFALFHRACTRVRHTLPSSSKTMASDIQDLLDYLSTDDGRYEYGAVESMLRQHCEAFLEKANSFDIGQIDIIPVFVDWNIGNFSLSDATGELYSRWDYDWFRMSSRMIDFYFFSRVVSDVGDRTVFTYNIDVMGEERFIHFLRHYHAVFPLTRIEIELLPEMYRFFLLNYVIKFGKYFFHDVYATKLRRETFEQHLPSIEHFSVEPLLKALNL